MLMMIESLPNWLGNIWPHTIELMFNTFHILLLPSMKRYSTISTDYMWCMHVNISIYKYHIYLYIQYICIHISCKLTSNSISVKIIMEEVQLLIRNRPEIKLYCCIWQNIKPQRKTWWKETSLVVDWNQQGNPHWYSDSIKICTVFF